MSLMLPRSLLRACPRTLVRTSRASSTPGWIRTMSSVSEETPATEPQKPRKRVKPVTDAEGTSRQSSLLDAEMKPKRTRTKRAVPTAEETSELTATEETTPKRIKAKRVPKADATTAVDITDAPKKRTRTRKAKETKGEDTEAQLKLRKKPGPKPRDERPIDRGDGVELPPIDKWRDYFPYETQTFKRVAIRNPETAKLLAETFVPEGSKDLVIIEANPGPGQLTRALLALPRERIKKIIIVEDNPHYLYYLHPLAKVDDRVSVIPLMAKQWASYTDVEGMGLMDDVKVQQDFSEGVHPSLRFIMHIPMDVYGEQFVAQLMRTIPDRQWQFKYGRVPLHLIVPDKLWKRIGSPPGTPERCKASVMCEAAVHMETAVPFDSLQPYNQHFYPTDLNESKTRASHLAVTMIPHEHQVIQPGDLEFWDYCVRKMFVQSNTPVTTTINSLGPGAFNMLPKLTDPNLPKKQQLDTTKIAKTLSIHDWELLITAFKKWPFRPQDLSIDGFNTKGVRENNNR